MQLAGALAPLGECIAIVRAGEPRRRQGFRGICVEDADWQGVVTSLIERSLFVIVRASRLTSALLWELNTIVARCDPERLLIFLPYALSRDPFVASRDYARFRDEAAALFPKSLPEWEAEAVFIVFESDWTPWHVPRMNCLGTAVTWAAAWASAAGMASVLFSTSVDSQSG